MVLKFKSYKPETNIYLHRNGEKEKHDGQYTYPMIMEVVVAKDWPCSDGLFEPAVRHDCHVHCSIDSLMTSVSAYVPLEELKVAPNKLREVFWMFGIDAKYQLNKNTDFSLFIQEVEAYWYKNK